MSNELHISDRHVVSDNKKIRAQSFSLPKQNDHTKVKSEYITKQVLNEASQSLQAKWNFLEERMKDTTMPVSIIKSLTDQQKAYKLAREKLEPFINGKKQFSSDQLDAIKRPAETAEESKVNCHIADALLSSIEEKKQELIDWKQKFDKDKDKYSKAVENLRKAHKHGEAWYKQGQEGTLKSPKEEYNEFVKMYNKDRKTGVLLNAKISKYNTFFPEKTPIKEQELPEELQLLNETSSIKSNLTLGKLGQAALMGLAAASLVDPVSARPTNALAQVNGDGFVQEPTHMDHLVRSLEI